jgi:TonB family protein
MARIAPLTVLLLAAAGGPALAQTAWIGAPTAADMAAAYPAKAKAEHVAGGVELTCTANRKGAMTDCDVLGESPRGYGFGNAARDLARKLVAQGVVNGQEVRVPISFAPDGTVKTPRWTVLPSVADMQAAVPKTEGGPNDIRVTLVCGVQDGGALSGCAVDREEPAGQGFGQAILALAPKFRTSLMSLEGMPTVGARVRVPVRFALKPVEQAQK